MKYIRFDEKGREIRVEISTKDGKITRIRRVAYINGTRGRADFYPSDGKQFLHVLSEEIVALLEFKQIYEILTRTLLELSKYQ